jgi:hypothetical protein
MYPQKTKDFIPDFAAEIGIPVEDLEAMVVAEFQAVKDAMGQWEHNMIFLERLGTFFFRVWKIEGEVKKCNNILRDVNRPVSFLYNTQELKENLIKMDAIILDEMIRRQKIRDIKLETEHLPSELEYRLGCRCDGCKNEHNIAAKKLRKSNKEVHLREKKRLKKLKEYETKRDIPKGLGE